MIRYFGFVLILLPICSTADLLNDLEFVDVRLGQKIDMGPIEPERVRGFEVLYATPGSGDVSEIAGHLLLRIMLDNNPDADAMMMENPNDLVISFLADTEAGMPAQPSKPVIVKRDCHHRNWFNLVENRGDEESSLRSIWQSLKGLSGGFRIIMDRQTLGHALKSYTIEQDRDLLRYRLMLTEEQKADLLSHLLWVKDNYQPRYYFFSQNCGSVLIQIIGEGVGNDLLSGFDHWVTPPNTLLGNMVREGLAVREVPAFYSYRKRGLIARKIFEDEYLSLVQNLPEVNVPSLSEFFHRKDTKRTRAIAMLEELAIRHPHLRPEIYRLAVLAQETEMIHSHKDWVCEDYTSAATAEARRLQKSILFMSDENEVKKFDVLDQIQKTYAPLELEEVGQGTPHTGVVPLSIGAGIYDEDTSDADGVLILQSSFLTQEMGSPSSVAMQRQSAVRLGAFRMIADNQEVKEWSFTGLRLTKFRDTLLGVPSVLSSTRGLGLGLKVLDVEHRREIHQTEVVIVGISVLGNVISSANYNNFIFFSIGADTVIQDEKGQDNFSFRFPIGAESLVSFGRMRNFQWRSEATYHVSAGHDNRDELELSTRLESRLGEWRGGEFWLGVSVDYAKEFSAGTSNQEWERTLGSCQIQMKRW